jgi:hypothetical protein
MAAFCTVLIYFNDYPLFGNNNLTLRKFCQTPGGLSKVYLVSRASKKPSKSFIEANTTKFQIADSHLYFGIFSTGNAE